ncbi:ubiquinol oxidase subunit II [Acidocella aminolytica]|uniref:Cytochrome o ubiquinol oxidase subunit II n=1 Tax=Acidocella aminolytica 101 = DSM 11237 TaxID=1120923 RepID=A0A0D6PKB8_9PROT|nr:COX aromatic rich motif-containing protein [Acidocella aminolytica]GAN81179.1 cytochrome o ubiquinol oxidase subunit II [Acidocella aminolytica 101 = DSM 11237]GBQ35259.1 putative cytochrome c oxidase subunit II [Acidocella aminolytica 101 = DSM 11237]SHF58631.1 cytochrome o ubiquinol oxidase subunit 2 [Acidocella aminolytica 101 = DSM 11237]
MRLKSYLALLPVLALGACSSGDYRLFHPANLIAAQEWHATIVDTVVMLLIILPVLFMIALFAWRYRKGANAAHDPEWSHNTLLELLVWGVPFLVVAALGIYSIKTIYAVEPYNPGLFQKQVAADPQSVVNVDVIATDWQWVFVYPDQKIATIDDLVVPKGSVVKLHLTSTSVSNDIYVPQLLPMIAVMPGMRTIDTFDTPDVGSYTGFGADFSGAGFSWMQFATKIVTPAQFQDWVQKVASSPNELSYAAFQKVAQPQVNMGAKISYFSNPDPQLFHKVIAAAQAGVVYPVSDALTKSIASDEK